MAPITSVLIMATLAYAPCGVPSALARAVDQQLLGLTHHAPEHVRGQPSSSGVVVVPMRRLLVALLLRRLPGRMVVAAVHATSTVLGPLVP